MKYPFSVSIALLGLVIAICPVLFFAETQQVESWRSIRPLVSTLLEVEKRLGPPTKIDRRNRYYDTSAGERVTIWYSGEPDNSSCKWRIPDDTVVRMIVSPRKKTLLSKIGFDLSKFETRGTLDDEIWNLVNEEKGILIEVYVSNNSDPGSNEKIVSFVEFFPTRRERHEKCVQKESDHTCEKDGVTP